MPRVCRKTERKDYSDLLRELQGKGIFSVVTPTASMQRSGRGMAAVQCGFTGWEKNTIYLP